MIFEVPIDHFPPLNTPSTKKMIVGFYDQKFKLLMKDMNNKLQFDGFGRFCFLSSFICWFAENKNLAGANNGAANQRTEPLSSGNGNIIKQLYNLQNFGMGSPKQLL